MSTITFINEFRLAKLMFGKMLGGIKSIFKSISKFLSAAFNFIFLFIVYVIGIGPVSLIMKLFGKHFLELNKSNKKSAWIDHKVKKQPLEKYYRTF